MSPQAPASNTFDALARLATAITALGEACGDFLATIPPTMTGEPPAAPPVPSAASPDALATARAEGRAEALDAVERMLRAEMDKHVERGHLIRAAAVNDLRGPLDVVRFGRRPTREECRAEALNAVRQVLHPELERETLDAVAKVLDLNTDG